MRTSFHHQPEAQHPNFQLSTAGRPITPSFGSKADISDVQRLATRRKMYEAQRSPFIVRCPAHRQLSPVLTILRLLRTAARRGGVRFLFLPCSALLFAPSSGDPQALA